MLVRIFWYYKEVILKISVGLELYQKKKEVSYSAEKNKFFIFSQYTPKTLETIFAKTKYLPTSAYYLNFAKILRTKSLILMSSNSKVKKF